MCATTHGGCTFPFPLRTDVTADYPGKQLRVVVQRSGGCGLSNLLVNQWLLGKGIILERPMSGETGQKVEWVMWANSLQPSNNRS